MASMNRISWWNWIPWPWRKWSVVLAVDDADEIPERLPRAGVVVVGDIERPKWIAFDCPCRRGHRVMLNMDWQRRPYWLVNQVHPLTLSPSVNDFTIDENCHYFVTDGRIRWVEPVEI
jgi:hypothetical protein